MKQKEESKCANCAMKRGCCPALLTPGIAPTERDELCKASFVLKTEDEVKVS